MAKKITHVLWEAMSALPSGLILDPNTGVISGTPTCDPNDYQVSIKVTTNYGSDTKIITIKVAVPEDWKPVIAPGQEINCEVDKAITNYIIQGTNVTLTV